MKITKLLSLFVLTASLTAITQVKADYYDDNGNYVEYYNDGYYNNGLGEVVAAPVRAAGEVVEDVGVAAGNIVEGTAEAAGDVVQGVGNALGGIFGGF